MLMSRGLFPSTDPPSGGRNIWRRLGPSEDIKPHTESDRDSEMREDEQSNEYDSRKAEYKYNRHEIICLL